MGTGLLGHSLTHSASHLRTGCCQLRHRQAIKPKLWALPRLTHPTQSPEQCRVSWAARARLVPVPVPVPIPVPVPGCRICRINPRGPSICPCRAPGGDLGARSGRDVVPTPTPS